MSDQFHQGLMLGRVLELSEHTASKVDVIEARQLGLIRRIETLESGTSPKGSKAAGSRPVLAALAALTGVLANLKAEQIAEIAGGLLRGLYPH